MKNNYRLIASCGLNDLDIRNMIAKCFYDTPNKAKYNLETGEVSMSDKIIPEFRVIRKNKRVRLEYAKME
jgi:hypothetical protein